MTTIINFKLSKELKNQLIEEAKEKNITLSAYIKMILSERKK